MNIKVTIYDVAREAGVGIGTVSRVLNNHPSVTPETRKLVKDVLVRLNYQPHTYAQRLAKRHSETISAIIPFFSTYFFVEVLRGVQDKISQTGYDLVLYGVNDPQQVDSYIIRALDRGRVDGILFFSMQLPDHIVPRLRETATPIVLVDSSSPDFDSISVANAEGAYVATNHLIELGYESVGMIGANPTSNPAAQRLAGFRRAIESHNITFDESIVRRGTSSRLDGFNREAGYQAMTEFLEDGSEMPKAFFVSSDVQAIGALDALNEHGLEVPKDVALVGFDDIELARHVRLTTMRQPMYQMGALAVERLLARMGDPALEILHTTFSPTLIIRESCGAILRSRITSGK